MKTKIALMLTALVAAFGAHADDKPGIPRKDRIRLAEAFRIGDQLGNRIWKDWDKAPFSVLFVMLDYEFLVRCPRPMQGFIQMGLDQLLRSELYYRKRTQPTNFLELDFMKSFSEPNKRAHSKWRRSPRSGNGKGSPITAGVLGRSCNLCIPFLLFLGCRLQSDAV
jgi:hypothetical protein